MIKPIYIVLDTETTGLDTNTAGIISFSYIITNLEQVFERGTIEMNPFESEADVASAAEALKVNGYTPEQVASFQSASEGMKQVALVFERATLLNNGYWPRIMGYNVATYDMPIILNNAQKHDVVLPRFRYDYVDVLQGVRMLDAMGLIPCVLKEDGKQMGNRLSEVVHRLNIPADQSKFHGSMYDTEMTLEVFKAIRTRITKNEGDDYEEDIGCEWLQ